MKNAKKRFIIGIGLAIVMVLALFFTKNAWLFKALYAFAVIMSTLEIFSAMPLVRGQAELTIVNIAACVLAGSVIAIIILNPQDLLLICLAACLTDSFAYLVGSLFHGKIFKKGKPFPVVSPNKSWEGILGGVLGGVTSIVIFYAITKTAPSTGTMMFVVIATPAAIFGDALESLLKRQFGIKDANDFTKHHQILKYPEKLLGGSDGHGGYYDRIDSISMVACAYLLCSIANNTV